MRSTTVLVSLLFGTLGAAATPADDMQAQIAKAVDCIAPPVVIENESSKCKSLDQLMQEQHVPGVSIAVVHKGAVQWARGFGVRETGGTAVTATTLFQAGSISKPVATLAALHLVQEGRLKLDADVNAQLSSWKVPANAAFPGAVVTLRELLTHTAGTTVHGFPGYAAGTAVATLVQVLVGKPPANTPAIRLESTPGSKWNYSGGGFTIMQQLVLDASKQSFPDLLQNTVLIPIGMVHSTYHQPLPENLRSTAAMPYDGKGTAIAGGPHTYPEMAAAGLWTTPSDIATYIIEVQKSLLGQANHVLSQKLTQEMVTAGKGHWGLGLQIGGSAGKPYFSHGGVNEGYESLFVGYEQGGDGAVVMTNAQGGTRIAEQVMGSIAAVYQWPDFHPAERTKIDLDRRTMEQYTGEYQMAPEFSLTFTVDGDHLMMQPSGEPKVIMYAESEKKFFLTEAAVDIEFVRDEKGRVSSLMLYQGDNAMKAVRK